MVAYSGVATVVAYADELGNQVVVSDEHPLPISGGTGGGGAAATSIEVSNFPATQAVSVATVPSHPVTFATPQNVQFATPQAVTVATIPTHAVTQSGVWTSNAPALTNTSTALTTFRTAALGQTPALTVKTSAARWHQYNFFNPNDVPVYIHIYNALLANVTPGTTVPTMTLGVGIKDSLDGYWANSHNWSTGLTISASTAANGTGAPTLPVIATLGYL